MIKTLSPHYLTIPKIIPDLDVETICTYYILKVYVWSGNKSAIPSAPDYEITKINAAQSDADDKVDIARIVNDFIEFNIAQSTVTSLENGNNQYWVMTAVYYDDAPTIPRIQSISLATKGYGYFMEGENPQIPANKILLQGDEYKVNRGGTFVLPIMMAEPTPATGEIELESVVYDGDDGTFTFTWTSNFALTEILAQNKAPADPGFSTDLFALPAPSPAVYTLPINIPPVTGLLYRVRAFNPLTSSFVTSNEILVT